jgi:hypothetical protein
MLFHASKAEVSDCFSFIKSTQQISGARKVTKDTDNLLVTAYGSG